VPNAFPPVDLKGLVVHGDVVVMRLSHGVVMRSADTGAELSRLEDPQRYSGVELHENDADLLVRLNDPPSEWQRLDPGTGLLSASKPPAARTPRFKDGVFRDRAGREHALPIGLREGAYENHRVVGDRAVIWATATRRDSPNDAIAQALELHMLPGARRVRIPGTHVLGAMDGGATSVSARFWLASMTLGGPTVLTLYDATSLEPLRSLVTSGNCQRPPSAGPFGAAVVDCNEDNGETFARAMPMP
jgi:hypothetical protein